MLDHLAETKRTHSCGALRQSDQPGGGFEVAGNYNLGKKSGQIQAQLLDLNQNTLKSFLAAALGNKQLESITINSKTTAKLNGPEDMAVKTELHVANLVVNDPSGQVPHTPLGVDLSADVAKARQVTEIHNVTLALAKTERAPNSLNVSGRIDMSKSNAWTGNVKIASDGLDVTPYYDLFVGNKPKTTENKSALPPEPQPPQETRPPSEPAAMNLPFAPFTADVNIAKLFLREVAISNFVTKAVIDQGRVNVNPFSLSLNGAPVTMTTVANLAVAGYEYDVIASLDHVPVEPFVNSFVPDKRGQIKGDLVTGAQIKGAGVTGASMKRNLGGSVLLALTNADVQVTQNKWAQRLLKPLALVLSTPELADSPLNWIDARVGIGSGAVTITNAVVRSSLFSAGVNGTMTLDDVLTNSTINNMPVQIAVVGSVARRLKVLSTSSASADVVQLPQFYAIGGTLGSPDPHIDKLALFKSAVSEVIGRVGGDTGNLLKGVGGALGLSGTANQTGAATNAPATNSGGNLLQGIGNLFQKPAKAADAATNAPAPKKKKFNLNDLLK